MNILSEDNYFKERKVFDSHYKISTKRDIQHIKDTIRNAVQRAKDLGSMDALVKDKDNYLDSNIKSKKGLSTIVYNMPYLRDRVLRNDYPKKDYQDKLSRAGYYNPTFDEVRIEPKFNFFDFYSNNSADKQLNEKLLSAPLTLRHELSHREQYRNALNYPKPTSYDKNLLVVGTADADALKYFDPDNNGLTDYIDTQVWEENPEEWLAVADEVGYYLHLQKEKGININYPISKETILDIVNSNDNTIPRTLKNNLRAIAELFMLRARDTDPEIWENVMQQFIKRVNESYNIGETEISDENLKDFEGAMLKKAEYYDGGKDIESQLYAEAINAGCSEQEASEVVARVMKRLAKTKTGRKGGALGVAHQPTDQYKAIASRMKDMHSY
jgi:hypothetical protein